MSLIISQDPVSKQIDGVFSERSVSIKPIILHEGVIDDEYHETFTSAVLGTQDIPQWMITNGLLPTGLELLQNGTLIGQAKETGTFTFSVTVSVSGVSDEAEFSIIIKPFAITTDALDEGITGVFYRYDLTTNKETAIWTITNGSLPPGMTLNSQTGAITGRPKVTEGVYTFTVHAEHGRHQAEKEFSLNVVQDSRLPVSSATWSAKGLPMGLHLFENGVLAGTPLKPGDYLAEISVRTNWGSDAIKVRIKVI